MPLNPFTQFLMVIMFFAIVILLVMSAMEVFK
jgi:hypothetical protein